jgi:hypothetical protein
LAAERLAYTTGEPVTGVTAMFPLHSGDKTKAEALA